MTQPQNQTSPSWGTNTKLVVALTIVVIIGALLVKFQFIITPLLIALLLAYLFYPIASYLQRKLRFSWNASVAVIYLVIIILLLGLLTIGGVGLLQQIQSLVTIVQNAIAALPQLIASISGKVYQFGPFTLDFSALDLRALSHTGAWPGTTITKPCWRIGGSRSPAAQPPSSVGHSLSSSFHTLCLQKVAAYALRLFQWMMLFPSTLKILSAFPASWAAPGMHFYADK